jgi:hypothetical protein
MFRPARIRTAALATLFLLLLAATAFSAPDGHYKGKTSQREPISLMLSSAGVTGLRFKIDERCPDGHTLIDDESGFGVLRATNGKFGGNFVPAAHPRSGEHTTVSGTVGANRVSGSISSATRSNRRGRPLCRGSMTFSLRHT